VVEATKINIINAVDTKAVIFNAIFLEKITSSLCVFFSDKFYAIVWFFNSIYNDN